MQPNLLCSASLSLLALCPLSPARAQGSAPDSPAPATAPLPPQRDASEIVIARVEGHELTLGEAIDTFLSSHSGHGVLVRGDAAVRELAGRLVERELFLLEAEALGLPESQRVQDVLRDYHATIAGDEHWDREVKRKAVVTDEEVESFYAKTDVALRLTLIVSPTREAAEALRARVAAGEDMAKLARTESVHESRTFDGALPYVRRGELERQVEDAAFALEKPGDLSVVVPSDRNFAFVRLEERSANPERPPRETAIPQIRGILEERLVKKLAKEFEERTQREAEAWIDEAALTRELLLDGPDTSQVVARVSDDTLTLQDVRDALELESVRAAPPDQTVDVARDVARFWVRAESIKRSSRKAGLLEDPGILKKVASFRRDVLMKVLCDEYVWNGIAPSEEEVRAYYEQRKDTEFTIPPEVRLAYIVVGTSAEAYSVLDRIASGESFEQLARELSRDSASSVHGGRIGWVKPGELLPAVEERAFALKAGSIDGPIETDLGFFVVKAIERKDARVVGYAVARDTARRSLFKQRQSEAYAKWANALRERADAELVETGVAEAVAWLDGEWARREAEKASRPRPAGEAPRGHGSAPTLEGVKNKPREERP